MRIGTNMQESKWVIQTVSPSSFPIELPKTSNRTNSMARHIKIRMERLPIKVVHHTAQALDICETLFPSRSYCPRDLTAFDHFSPSSTRYSRAIFVLDASLSCRLRSNTLLNIQGSLHSQSIRTVLLLQDVAALEFGHIRSEGPGQIWQVNGANESKNIG
jgi:hypothetical protein